MIGRREIRDREAGGRREVQLITAASLDAVYAAGGGCDQDFK
jgi:hypothetical protein